MVYPFKYWTGNGTASLTVDNIANEPSMSISLFNVSSSTKRPSEPFQSLKNVPWHQLTRKQKNNRRTNELKRSKRKGNTSSYSEWDYVTRSKQCPLTNDDDIWTSLCPLRNEIKHEWTDVSSVYPEGSVNANSLSDSDVSSNVDRREPVQSPENFGLTRKQKRNRRNNRYNRLKRLRREEISENAASRSGWDQFIVTLD